MPVAHTDGRQRPPALGSPLCCGVHGCVDISPPDGLGSVCLSVDHSRIKLHQEENDYINASLITMEEAQRSYILTQVNRLSGIFLTLT